jgi:hypothetical protein
MLSYGVPADFMDQYIRIGESTVIESLRRFITAVVDVFGEEYLRSPNENDTSRLLTIGQRRGFSWNAWEFGLHALEVEELS